MASGSAPGALANPDLGEGSYTQIGAELLYRFGATENFYIGGRYNAVTGKATANASATDADRLNVGAGWFLTINVLAKVEYVNQNYAGDGWAGRSGGGSFEGFVFEAVIGF